MLITRHFSCEKLNLWLSYPLVVLCLVGCSRNQQPLPNPFANADRVPPPMTRAPGPGAAQPYYSTTPSPSLPANTPYTPAGTPLGANNQSNPQQLAAATSPGDPVSIPSDGSSLRFGSASRSVALATPSAGSMSSGRLAEQRPTANGWISGSAPVRNTISAPAETAVAQTRVRIPGGQGASSQPVNIAALSPSGESSGSGQNNPYRNPASVATNPQSSTGWR